MEEKQYTSLTVPTDYLQHWYQSTEHLEHIEPLQTAQYQQMTNATHLMESLGEERVMTELAVPQDPDCHLEVDSHLETDCNLEPDSHLQPNPHLHPDSHLHPDLHLPSDLHLQPDSHLLSDSHLQPDSHPAPEQAPRKGKRGRPPGKSSKAKQMLTEPQAKVPRKTDRFNGMSVAEVMAKTLPDILTYNLDILIIGINPGLMSAYKGRHYPNPGNHFWKCLFLSGLTEVQLNHMHDQTLPEKYGIGFTNMVERTTPGSKDLSSKEFREGGRLLVEKLKKYKPLIAVFNGKCIYDIFSKEIFGVKAKNLQFGIQPHKIPDTETVCYLMPSSSARCAQFPRAQDKVHFYIKLRELRDQLKGVSQNQEVQEMDYSFDVGMAKEDSKRIKIKEEQEDPRYDAAFGPTCGEEEPETSGRHCDFSFPETPQNTEVPIKQELLPDALGWAPEERWMMQSFADQIPDISGSGAQTQLWAKSI